MLLSLRQHSLETSPFRSRSCKLLCSRKISASSIRTMAFQVVAKSSASFKLLSTNLGSTPSSPQVMVYSGRLVWSATLSVYYLVSSLSSYSWGLYHAPAVSVLPTPGTPCSRNTMPFPFPLITSSNDRSLFVCTSTKE
jgi:hypothetical protein